MIRIFVRFIDVDLCFFFISIASVIVQKSVRKLFLYEKIYWKKVYLKKILKILFSWYCGFIIFLYSKIIYNIVSKETRSSCKIRKILKKSLYLQSVQDSILYLRHTVYRWVYLWLNKWIKNVYLVKQLKWTFDSLTFYSEIQGVSIKSSKKKLTFSLF